MRDIRRLRRWAPLILGLAACGGEAPMPVGELPSIPYPDTGRMEEAVATQLDSARRHLNGLLRHGRNPTEPAAMARVFRELGTLYLAYDLEDAALVAFENAEALAPNDAVAPYYLGHIHRGRGELHAARDAYGRSLEDDESFAPAWIRLGDTELALGDPGASERAYRRARALGELAAGTFGLGRVAMETGEYREALDHLSDVLALEPEASPARHHLAAAHRALGRPEAAMRVLRRGGNRPVPLRDSLLERITRRRSGAAAHAARADAAATAGRLEEAARAYRAAADAAPENFSYRKSLGATLWALGRPGPAIEALRAALEREPAGNEEARSRETLEVHFNLAGMLTNTRQFARAEEHYRAVLELDPQHRDAAFRLAEAVAAQGRLPEAASVLTELLHSAPEDVEALELRATLRMDLGEFGRAIPDLQRLLELDPDHRRAARLLEIARTRAGGP